MASTAPVMGHQTRLAVGSESTWGTAVARDRSFKVVSTSLERDVGFEPRENLLHAASDRLHAKHIRTHDHAGGAFKTELLYEGCGLLLRNLIGAVSTTGPSTDLYTHTYAPALAAHGSMTMEQIWYELATPGFKAEVFEGCLFGSGSISGNVGKAVMLDGEIVAQTSGGIVAAGSVTDTTAAPFTTTNLPVLFNQAGTFTYNSVALNIMSFSLKVNNDLVMRDLFGSLNTARPAARRQVITIDLGIEWDAETMDAALVADTEASFVLAFSTTASKTLTINGYNAYVTKCGRPISDAGIVKQTVTLMLQTDGTNKGCSVVIVNGQSSGIAV